MEDRQSKRTRMLALVADFEYSDLSLKSYCEQVGIKTHTYYYWKRRSEMAKPDSGFELIHIKAMDQTEQGLFLRLGSDLEIHGASGEELIELVMEIDRRRAEF